MKLIRISAAAVLLLWQIVSPPTAFADTEMCDPLGTVPQGPYVVSNGQWGVQNALQCISVGDTGFRVSRLIGFSPDPQTPISYPSILSGCVGSLCSPDRTIPIRLGDLNSAVSSVSFDSVDRGSWNATYDIFLNPPPSAPRTKRDPRYEIMIFLRLQDRPVTGTVPVFVDGRSWLLDDRQPANWLNASGYFPPAPIPGGTFNIKAFIDDVRSRHPEIGDDWTFHTLGFGFECWSDCAGVGVTSFQTAIN